MFVRTVCVSECVRAHVSMSALVMLVVCPNVVTCKPVSRHVAI